MHALLRSDSGSAEIYELLIKHGADSQLKNHIGLRAIDAVPEHLRNGWRRDLRALIRMVRRGGQKYGDKEGTRQKTGKSSPRDYNSKVEGQASKPSKVYNSQKDRKNNRFAILGLENGEEKENRKG